MQIRRRGIRISQSGKFIKKEIDRDATKAEQEQKTLELSNEISFYKANAEVFLSDLVKYSPNINCPFIIFKKTGTSLVKFLKTKRKPETLIKICKKIIDFYTILHKKGYLHYDVSSEHVYIYKGRIYVIDFGFAHKLNVPNLNYKGGFVFFISPGVAKQMRENFGSQVKYTIGDELFSLGLTLYYFLYNKTYIDIINTDKKELNFNERLEIMSKFDLQKLYFDSKYKEINEIIINYFK